MKALACAMALALGLTGCAVGPDYAAPQPSLPESLTGLSGSAATVGEAPVAEVARFWLQFEDPDLPGLVDLALKQNDDLRLAAARVREASAVLREAEAADRPGVGLTAGFDRTLRPLSQQPGTSQGARLSNQADLSLVTGWELDLFGRIQRAEESALAELGGSLAARAAMQVSVAAEVSRQLIVLRGLQEQLGFVQQRIQNQSASLKLVQARVDAGRSSPLDLAQAKGLLASTQALEPALRAELERAALRIATLTGQKSSALVGLLGTSRPLPTAKAVDLSRLQGSSPQAWLARRPDLIAAERSLASATAQIGVATAALYPSLSLSGVLGVNAAAVEDLNRAVAQRFSLGAGLSWTPFDLGTLRARIRIQEARTEQALIRFEQQLRLALEETEGSLLVYSRAAEQAERQSDAVQQSLEAARLAQVRHEAGLVGFQAVLDAERELLAAKATESEARLAVATGLVAVYRAFGGGWAGSLDLD